MTSQRIIFSFATNNLRLHWLRSLLAVIGIIIGVLSIISMGMIQNVTVMTNMEQWKSLDSFQVNLNTDYAEKEGIDPYISERQADQIQKISTEAIFAPYYYDSDDTIKHKKEKLSTTIYGIKPQNLNLLFEFQVGNIPRSGNEIVIGADLAKKKNLWIGSQIIIISKDGQEIPTRVVGVLKPYPQMWMMSPDQAIFPYEPWLRERIMFKGYNNVLVKVKNTKNIETIKQNILTEMNKRKTIMDIFDLNEYRNQWIEDMQKQAASATATAGISLIVAGVSIFNVMVMSVIERYREIGVLRSIGTRRSAIMCMFIYESFLLGLLGAILGGISGVIIGYTSISLMSGLKYFYDPSTLISIPYGMSYGIAISLISGIYPAWKASRLNPIEALRQE
nr:FtsX-like permease family protein [uncultured Methanospirillum sp.]